MKSSPSISIIANFYNSERFIPKLIKSIAGQSFRDWELICVNDCSPGNDQEIINKEITKLRISDKVKLINNEVNLGISRAKMVGIKVAQGDYLTFIDGDDWLAPDALEKLIKPALKHDLDLVVMNNYKILPCFNYKILYRSQVDEFDKVLRYPEIFEKYYINFFGINIFSVTYWGKLYKRDLVLKANFVPPADSISEDELFNLAVFPHVRSMMFIDYAGYYWRWGGITSGKKNDIWTSQKYLPRMLEIYHLRKDLIDKYNYNKAFKYLVIELKNILKTCISSLAKYKSSSIDGAEIIKYIETVLKDPAYNDVKVLQGDGRHRDDPFIEAICRKDALSVYEICHLDYKKRWRSRMVKSLLHILIYGV